MLDIYYRQAVEFLSTIIRIPSFSREERHTAEAIALALKKLGITADRLGNNVWARNKYYDPKQPTLLLNSHHDTVRPNSAYLRDPFRPDIENGKLYGLGSNDAGASLVALLQVFIYFYERKDLPFNIIYAASAEEEVSGAEGMEALVQELPEIWAAIVGEPTGMQMAIAEKGLMVIDALARGRAGHAARDEGLNAIDIALRDIQKINQYAFGKVSPTLGMVKKSVTVIQAGKQHNVVPAECAFTIDVRVTDQYTHKEILQELQALCQSSLNPRSMRLRSSGIPDEHVFIALAEELGIVTYGSPTLSDQALMPWPSVKMGIGDSARSHMADEYVYLYEIKEGIERYISFIEALAIKM